jgi:tetratricopeptide (TPR) repeat protein
MIGDLLTRIVSYPLSSPYETVFGIAMAVVIVGLIYFFFKFNRDIFRTLDIILVADGALAVFIVVFGAVTRNLPAVVVLTVLFAAAGVFQLIFFRKRGTGTISLPHDAKIAIMPFLGADGEPPDWTLGYGIADAVARALSCYNIGVLEPVRVATGAVRRNVKTEADNASWGEALEADYIVVGRARAVGGNTFVRYKVIGLFNRREWQRTRVLAPGNIPFAAAQKVREDLTSLFHLDVKNEAALAYYREPTKTAGAWLKYCEGRAKQIAGTPEDLAAARDCFQGALAEDEDFTLAAVGLVEIHLQFARREVREEEKFLSLLEEAYRIALRTVRQRPELHETQNIMGEVFVFLSGGRDADLFRRAQTRFLEAVRLNPNSARSWYNLALISKYSVPEEDVGYADFLGKALTADPSYVTARLALARHLMERNDAEGARRQYRLALTYNPRNAAALNELGFFYLKRDDTEHAAEILERAKDVDAKNHLTRYYLGLAYYQRGAYDKAEQELWAAVAFKPNEVKYLRYLAAALEGGGKQAEAISVWEEVFKRTSDKTEAQKIGAHIGKLAEKVKHGG